MRLLGWIGVALLSASWLWGVSHYRQTKWPQQWDVLAEQVALMLRLEAYPDSTWPAWGLMVVLGIALLASGIGGAPTRSQALLAAGLITPALVFSLWPYWRVWVQDKPAELLPYPAAMVLLVLGAAVLQTTALSRRLTGAGQRVGGAMIAGGAIMLAQWLSLWAYQTLTARSHDLPPLLSNLLAAVVRMLGVDACASHSWLYGQMVTVFSMRENHRLAPTWDLLVGPVTMCFLVGSAVYLAWQTPANSQKRWWWLRWLSRLGMVVLLTALWLPVRAGVMIALYLNDVLRTDYDAPLEAMRIFWNPWLHLLMILPPAVMSWRFTAAPAAAEGQHPSPQPLITRLASEARQRYRGPQKLLERLPAWFRPVAAVVCALLGGAVLTAAVCYDPPGYRVRGEVLVEEYNPDPNKVWERVDRPYDVTWYGHDANYNYYSIANYSAKFYDFKRVATPLDDKMLLGCAVLIIKVPTRPFSDEEIESVVRFVERGGGLLLIGEHTDVYGTSTYLNPIAERFGFRFRLDCAFGIDSFFDDVYRRTLLPHPAVLHVEEMDFATSATIEPFGGGRAAILGTGLKNRMADYHVRNFYPQAVDSPEMRYGAFVQLWATRYGKGRVLAFSDSTIFSNFCTFEPGKAELWINMIEWLHRRNDYLLPRWLWFALGIMALVAAVVLAAHWTDSWFTLLGAGLCGFGLCGPVILWGYHRAMPPPEPHSPLVRLAMDRTVSAAVLPKNGFITGQQQGFGIFERWILRLGYFTAQRKGLEVFGRTDRASSRPDVVVVIYPNRQPSPRYLQRLEQYVADGGKLLLIDSADNEQSTANVLLEPFGIELRAMEEPAGLLQPDWNWPRVPVAHAREVSGGEPFARLGGTPVGSRAKYGKGEVWVVGFGNRFCDANMGFLLDVIPDDALMQVFNLQYLLIDAIVQGKPKVLEKQQPAHDKPPSVSP